MKISTIFPVIAFAGFVLWLLSIPMDGPLLRANGISDATNYFLPAHILSLLLIGFFCPTPLFKRFAPINCILAFVLTLALPLVDISLGRWLLVPLGVNGAFVSVSACITLRKSPSPLFAAACGLILANLLFFPLGRWPGGGLWEMAAAAIPLLFISELGKRLPEPGPDREENAPWHYLGFIVVFQIVSGLMYSFIMPAYNRMALLPGFELIFYVLAVAAAYQVAQKNRDLALVCAVILGMAAYALLQIGYLPLSINSGMFAMQAGAGFIDLAVIAILLPFPRPVKAFGIGLAAVCSGIAAGKIIGHFFSDTAEAIAMAGHIVLNLSMLTLYFLGRYHYVAPESTMDAPLAGEDLTGSENAGGSLTKENRRTMDEPIPDAAEDGIKLPNHLRLLLSEREYLVLEKALAGSTYRETARELEISESTVKTYMYRIYEKMGVKGKKKLFEKLNSF